MSQNCVQSFEKLCDAILEIGSIQSVSIINRKGREVEKKTRDGVVLFVHQKSEMLLMQCALAMSMGRDFDEDLGEIGYILVQRKDTSTISIPMNEHIVFVSSKTAGDIASLVKEVTTAIKQYQLELERTRHRQTLKTGNASHRRERVDSPDIKPNLILVQ